MKSWIAALPAAAALVLMTGTAHAADEQYAKIARVYNTYCVQCHGINRDGNGINSANLPVKPRDHTDKSMNDTPDDELRTAITEGGAAVNKSVLMPRWKGVLSDAEISDMVGYLRTLSKKQ